MVDLVLKGKITFKGNEDKFLEDFDKFLSSRILSVIYLFLVKTV